MTPRTPTLRRFTPDVLRDLMARLAGPATVLTVHISDGESERILYFADGRVRLISAGKQPPPDVPDALLERGQVDVEQLHEILETVRHGRETLREALIRRSVVGAEDLDRLSVELIQRELRQLVLWGEAYVSDFEGAPGSDVLDGDRPSLTARIHPEAFARDIVRWIDDWERHREHLLGPEATLRLSDAGRVSRVSMNTAQRQLLDACESGTSLLELSGRFPIPLGELCEELVKLVKRGLIDADWEGGADLESKSASKAEALEQGLSDLIGKSLVRRRLVDLYRRAGRPEKAVPHLERLAAEARSRGDWNEATQHWRDLLEILPTRFEVLGDIAEAGTTLNRVDDAREIIAEHVERVLEQKNPSSAHKLAKRLREIPGMEELADEVHTEVFKLKQKRRQAATADRVTELGGRAKRCQESGALQAAERSLQKALSFDPENEELQVELEQVRTQRQRRQDDEDWRREDRRFFLKIGAAAGGGIGLVIGLLCLCGVIPVGSWFSAATDGVAHADGPVPAPYFDPDVRPESSTTLEAGPGSGTYRGPDGRLEIPPPATPPMGAAADPFAYFRKGISCRAHAGRHLMSTRLLGPNLQITSGDSCDCIVSDLRQEGALFVLPGRPSTGWAWSPNANLICQWGPGQKLRIVRGLVADIETTRWALPDDTVAFAVGLQCFALRTTSQTAILGPKGDVLRTAQLPAWREGVITEDCLVLLSDDPQPGSERNWIWVYHLDSLKLIWSGAGE